MRMTIVVDENCRREHVVYEKMVVVWKLAFEMEFELNVLY